MTLNKTLADARPDDDARIAFELLRPVVERLIKMMATCPISDDAKKGLCLFVLTSLFGATMAQINMEPTPENAEAVGKLIADSMRARMH